MDLIRRLVMTKIKTKMTIDGRIIIGEEDGRARVLPAPQGNVVGRKIGAARAHRLGLHHDLGREGRSMETAELFKMLQK